MSSIIAKVRRYFGRTTYFAMPPRDMTDAERHIAVQLLKCSGAEIEAESGHFGFIYFKATGKQVKVISRRLRLFTIRSADIFVFQSPDPTTGKLTAVPLDEVLHGNHPDQK